MERKTEERKRNSERKRGGWGKKYVNQKYYITLIPKVEYIELRIEV